MCKGSRGVRLQGFRISDGSIVTALAILFSVIAFLVRLSHALVLHGSLASVDNSAAGAMSSPG